MKEKAEQQKADLQRLAQKRLELDAQRLRKEEEVREEQVRSEQDLYPSQIRQNQQQQVTRFESSERIREAEVKLERETHENAIQELRMDDRLKKEGGINDNSKSAEYFQRVSAPIEALESGTRSEKEASEKAISGEKELKRSDHTYMSHYASSYTNPYRGDGALAISMPPAIPSNLEYPLLAKSNSLISHSL